MEKKFYNIVHWPKRLISVYIQVQAVPKDEPQRSRQPGGQDLLQRHQDPLLRPVHIQGLRREDLVGQVPGVEGAEAGRLERAPAVLGLGEPSKLYSILYFTCTKS